MNGERRTYSIRIGDLHVPVFFARVRENMREYIFISANFRKRASR